MQLKNVSESADESLDWGRGADSLSVQSLAYVCISQWIIKTTAPVSLSLSFHDFISDCVHVPLSWYRPGTTVIRARKNKKTKQQKLVVLLLHSTMYVKCLISLSFDYYFLFLLLSCYASIPRLVSYRHVVTRSLGNGSVIEGGFDIESCNGIAWKRINAKLPDFQLLPRLSNSSTPTVGIYRQTGSSQYKRASNRWKKNGKNTKVDRWGHAFLSIKWLMTLIDNHENRILLLFTIQASTIIHFFFLFNISSCPDGEHLPFLFTWDSHANS